MHLNKSAKFCGVAEMVGHVDFGAITKFWEWKDKFPVKCHMIKMFHSDKSSILLWKAMKIDKFYAVEILGRSSSYNFSFRSYTHVFVECVSSACFP